MGLREDERGRELVRMTAESTWYLYESRGAFDGTMEKEKWESAAVGIVVFLRSSDDNAAPWRKDDEKRRWVRERSR